MRDMGRARDMCRSALHTRIPPSLGGLRGHRGRDGGGEQAPQVRATVGSDLEVYLFFTIEFFLDRQS